MTVLLTWMGIKFLQATLEASSIIVLKVPILVLQLGGLGLGWIASNMETLVFQFVWIASFGGLALGVLCVPLVVISQ